MTPHRSQWPSEDGVASGRGALLPQCHVVESEGPPELRRLALTERQTVHLIPLDSILWISAKSGRLSIHRASGELSASGALGTLTRALGAGFQRINRNVAVNMMAVREIRRRGRHGEGSVVLHDARQLPVTRLYAHSLRAWLSGRGGTP